MSNNTRDLLKEIQEEAVKEQRELQEKLKKEELEEDDTVYAKKTGATIKNGYKDRLTKVYDDLSGLNQNNIVDGIQEIKTELAEIIKEIEELEKNLYKEAKFELDEDIKRDKEATYPIPTKSNIVSSAKDSWTLTNILIGGLIVAVVIVGLVIAGALL